MARHSHWAQIKLKKGATDAKRGKIFTKHAQLIEVAARQAGGDPNMNAGLRLAIENARADNMPRENIERAIKKGTGEFKGAAQLQEITYEGYGPGGVAMLIETLTDNKNRTSQTIRNILQKNGGTMGGMGSTSFLFEKKGGLNVKPKGNRDDDELAMIDAGAEDIEVVEDEEHGSRFIVYTAANALGEVKKKLEAGGFAVESAQLINLPKNVVEIADPTIAQKIRELLEDMENEDDVSNVAVNCEYSNACCQ